MGSRKNGVITVSELVALAAPTHGVDRAFSCGNENEPDRSTRQLCGGMTAALPSQALPCGSCFPPAHPLHDQRGGRRGLSERSERARLQAQLQRVSHPFTGSGSTQKQTGCSGRCPLRQSLRRGKRGILLSRAGSPVSRLPGPAAGQESRTRCLQHGGHGCPDETHSNFPHHWPTICVTLRTIVNHQAPANETEACQELTQP